MARVVIVGLPGSGKSAVGMAAANRLGIPFLDLDEVIANQQGMTPAEIIRRDGEASFREIERQALATWIAADVVLATGGGVVVSEACRQLLKTQRNVAWLQATIESLVARSQSQDRPLLDGDREQRLRQVAIEREPWYREVATFDVDSEGTIDEVVESLLAGVRA